MKKIIGVLLVLILAVSFATAVPNIAVPSVSTPNSASTGNSNTVADPATQSTVGGPYVPSFLQSADIEMIESDVVGTEISELTEQEKIVKELSTQEGLSTSEFGSDELGSDTIFTYTGTLSSTRNWNALSNGGYVSWNFRWTGSSNWYIFHLKAPYSDLDLKLYEYSNGAYRQIASSTWNNSHEMIAQRLYYNNYYSLRIYKYGSPGYQTAYIYRYRAV